MSYVTQSEIEAAFGENELINLADRDGDGVADAPVIAAAISRATGVIDSYLRSRFTLPLVEVPDLVRECAIHIVRYLLAEDHATDRVVADHKQALAWLKDIREGNMDVGLTDANDAVGAASGGAQVAGGDAAFDQASLDAFAGRS